jgi:hypothetical protein
MIKSLKLVAAALVMSASASFAGGTPWEARAPSGMSAAHQQLAAQAHKVHASVSPSQFGFNPLVANWNYQGDRLEKTPVSNVSVNQLKAALTGRYFVYRMYTTNHRTKDNWSVMYFAKDGKTHMCQPKGSAKRYKETVSDRYIDTSAFGLGGLLHWDHGGYKAKTPPKEQRVGWPTIAGNNGAFSVYNYHRGKWHAEPGWIQSEYAAAFAEVCPNLPRVRSINNAQQGLKLSDIARGAKAHQVKPAFQNDTLNPLTAGMYYHLYPPAR